MRVLVTGHEGYLGTVICEVIGQAGHEVTGLDVGLFAGCVLGAPPQPPPALRIDVRDVLATDLAGFDAVIHLAALSNDPLGLRNATAFGYSARPRGDVVANSLAASAYLTGVVRVLSDGTPWRPLVHIRDIAGAFLAALQAPRQDVHDTAINVGSAAERGVSDLLSAYRRHGLTTAAFERHQRLPVLRALRAAGRLDADLRWTAPEAAR